MWTHLRDEAAAAHAEALAGMLDVTAGIAFTVTAALGELVRVGRGGRVRVVGGDGGHDELVAVAVRLDCRGRKL